MARDPLSLTLLQRNTLRAWDGCLPGQEWLATHIASRIGMEGKAIVLRLRALVKRGFLLRRQHKAGARIWYRLGPMADALLESEG